MADGSVKIDVGLSLTKAEKDLTKFKEKIMKAEDALNANSARKTELEKRLEELGNTAEAARKKIKLLREEYDGSRGSERASIKEQLDRNTENYNATVKDIDSLSREYQKVDQNIVKGTSDLEEMKQQAGDMAKQIEAARPGEALANSFETAKKSLAKFLKYSLGIRSVYILFQRLKSAVKDAVQEYAQYDKELKYNLSLMDATKKAIQVTQGSALAAVYTAILPIVQKIANGMLEASNAAAKFIAIVSGKNSYKRAVVNTNEVAASLEETSGAANDAAESAKEAKKQIMAFDELNIIDKEQKNEENNGKIDNNARDGIDLIDESIDEFDDSKLAKTARFVRDNMERIKDIALGIGAALGTWEIAKLIGKITGLSLATKTLLGIIAGIAGSIIYVKGFFDAWKNGLDNGNLTQMILGATAAIVGFGLAFGPVGAGIASLVTGLGFAVLGFKEWAETGKMTNKVLTAINAGIGLVGVSLALLTKSWIPLAISAVAMLLFDLPEVLNGLSGFFYSLGLDNLGDWFKGMSEKAKEARDWLRINVVKPVCKYITDAFNEWNTGEHRGEYKDSASWFICGVLGLPSDEDWARWAKLVTDFFTQRIAKWKEVLPKDAAGVALAITIGFIEGLWDAASTVISAIGNWITTYIINPVKAILGINSQSTVFYSVAVNCVQGLLNGWADNWGTFTKYITSAWTALRNWWSGLTLEGFRIKTPHLRWSTRQASGWIASTLTALGLPAVIPQLSVRWLARGGVFDRASLIGVGEAGKEAVVPLERNTEWMRVVADGLMQRLEQSNFADQLARAIATTPMPAMASGSVVPPRSVNNYSPSVGIEDAVRRGVFDAMNIAAAGRQGEERQPINVYIGDEKIASYILHLNNRNSLITGGR